MKKILLLLFCYTALLRVNLPAQIGGRHVFDFMNLSPSARLVSLGGVNVSTVDDDLNLAVQNPSLISDSMHKQVSLSFSRYLAGIRYGYAGYSHTFKGIGSFHAGIHYVNSGEMQGADVFGNLTQTFYANELAGYLGYSRAWKQFRYGANLKFISSTLGPGFTSTGLALDLGGSYTGKEKLFTAGAVIRNMGLQLSTYTATGGREPLPFEIVVGASNKLRYMPLRFSVTLTNLEHPNLIFEDPNRQPEFDLGGNEIKPPNQTVDRIFRHFVFGTEFLLGKSLRLRAGYNHLRRQELRSENRGGFTGFSLGAGIRAKRFAFDYGYTSYGISSDFNVHQFSLLLNLESSAKPATTGSW
ncbi:MAG: type IX secretion system protein PorQ [Bacteroidia bacterium]|nr:type IX secretion system protein PorQ [Bacteroidia bacterium]